MKKLDIKKVFVLTILILLILNNVSFARNINVYYQNEKIEMPVNPELKNGTTLVPIRPISEAMDLDIQWDNKNRHVVIERNLEEIIIPIGSKVAYINEKEVKLDLPVKIIDGSTLVPIRFVAENLGINVSWDQNTYSVLLNSNLPFGNYQVTRVIDGDTIKIIYNGKEESLRLIGVDTPESVHPDKSKNVFEGEIASKFTKSILENKRVGIEFDVQKRDYFGRLLGYVYYNGEMFNKTLLKKGYAKTATYPPNVKYVDDFVKTQKKAINNKSGFWKFNNFNNIEIYKNINEDNNVIKKQYTGSLNSNKFHKPSCSWGKKIKIGNRINFKSKNEALNKGYIPCKVCKP